MSGGAWESVMGVLLDSNGKPRSGYDSSYNSGFNGTLYSGTKEDGVDFPNEKYYDTYTEFGINDKGHALSEVSKTNAGTTSWYKDYSNVVSTTVPWFMRGGSYSYGTSAGVFSFNSYGGDGGNYSARVVLSETT